MEPDPIRLPEKCAHLEKIHKQQILSERLRRQKALNNILPPDSDRDLVPTYLLSY